MPKIRYAIKACHISIPCEYLILICTLTCMFTVQLQSYHMHIAHSTHTHTHTAVYMEYYNLRTVAVALYVLQNVLRMCIARLAPLGVYYNFVLLHFNTMHRTLCCISLQRVLYMSSIAIYIFNNIIIVNEYREVYSLHWYASRLRCVQTPWHPLHKFVLYMGDVPQLLTLVKPYTVGFTICTPGVHCLLGYLLTYLLCAPST